MAQLLIPADEATSLKPHNQRRSRHSRPARVILADGGISWLPEATAQAKYAAGELTLVQTGPESWDYAQPRAGRA